MSLRSALQSAVARCTPLAKQHATFQGNHATSHATDVQPMPANPHGIWVSGATGHATPVQQTESHDATRGDSGEKLHVAFASTCNMQPGPLTAQRLTADLLKAAMRVCDQYGDGDAARAQMRLACLDTPPHLRADLLAHFTQIYGGNP